MIRAWCPNCKQMQDHRLLKLGEGLRETEWKECQGCQRMERRQRRRSDWAGV
jgi:hypothetical protein